jgi:hypothetical protein
MKALVTICRNSHGEIKLYIRDDTSRIQFAEITMTPHDFANALTGLGEQSGELSVFGLEYVGKKKVSETRSIECPLSGYQKREVLEKWLEENAQEDGWLVSTYLGLPSSVGTKCGKTTLNYSVTKYV